MPSFSHKLHRGVRKALRPLRRALAGEPAQASIDELKEPTLVLIAHPDDEVFCSGLICHLRALGRPVHLLAFTRGEGGERGTISPDAKLASVREEELRAAANALDVSSLTFLDYLDPSHPDGRLTEPEHDSAELLAEIQSHLKRLEIAHLVTHGSGGEYWHPAHLCLHRHARILFRRNPDLQLWTFNAWNAAHPLPGILNQDDPSYLNLDSSDHSPQRLAALAAHHSQSAVFERFADGSLEDFIRKTKLQSFRKW